jgi:LmbE family N-acetylglucosaminyl deacetylase
MTRRLAAVFAHPDDDTYSVAGSMALHAGEDVAVIVVLATSGEAGQIADPSLATPENLGRVREGEDVASWREAGVPVEHHFLRFPDGGVADVPFEELIGGIVAALRETRPDVVVTFGPEGVTGHADHIAAGKAATEAFHRLRADGGRRLPAVALRLDPAKPDGSPGGGVPGTRAGTSRPDGAVPAAGRSGRALRHERRLLIGVRAEA